MAYKNCEHKNCKWYGTGTCILGIAKNNEKCKTKMDRKSPLKRLLDNIKILQEANALEAEFGVFISENPKLDSISELNDIIESAISYWE